MINEWYHEKETSTPGAAVLRDAVPEDLAELRQFVAWEYRERPGGGKPAKVPINPRTGKEASVDDPATWGTPKEARECAEERRLEGIGFVFTSGDPFAGVDLDGCRDPGTGGIKPWAEKIIRRFDSYTEVSPSGTGVKIVVRGTQPPGRKRRGPIEMYDRKRFFTLTGDVLNGHEAIGDRQETLEGLHARVNTEEALAATQRRRTVAPVEVEDHELLEKARSAGNGGKFRKLYDAGDVSGYGSGSETDLALCGMLAFWTGRNPERMDRIFRSSALYRPKWNRPDYREGTISLAVGRCERVYTPKPCAEGEVHRIIGELKEAALLDPWIGRSGPRERWLYHGLLDTGCVYGKACAEGVIVAASSRDLALKCGTKRGTVERRLVGLEERGLIRRIEKGSGNTASKYLLLGPTCKGGHKDAGRRVYEKALNYTPTVFIYGPLCARVRDAAPGTEKDYDRNGRKIPKNSSHVFLSLGALRALVIEKVVAWPGMDLPGLAAALGRDPRTIGKYMGILVEGGFLVVTDGTYSVSDNLADRLVDELDHSGCNDREKDLRDRYARDREEYERRRREKALEATARECGVEREPEPDSFIGDLERVEDPKPEPDTLPRKSDTLPTPKIAPVEEEIVAAPLSSLAVAVRLYLERNPRDAHQPAGWIGNTLWTYELHPKLDDSPAQTTAAIEELGGDAYLRDLKAVAA